MKFRTSTEYLPTYLWSAALPLRVAHVWYPTSHNSNPDSWPPITDMHLSRSSNSSNRTSPLQTTTTRLLPLRPSSIQHTGRPRWLPSSFLLPLDAPLIAGQESNDEAIHQPRRPRSLDLEGLLACTRWLHAARSYHSPFPTPPPPLLTSHKGSAAVRRVTGLMKM